MATDVMFTLLLTYLCCNSHLRTVEGKDQFGPLPEEVPPVKSLVTEDSSSDVSSVSRFIKDFQKKIDDSTFSTDKYELDFLKDYSSEYIQTGEEVVEDGSESESYQKDSGSKNVTSLVKCSTDSSIATLSVELVNATRLVELLAGNPNVTLRSHAAHCVILLFYSRSCPFSCMAAPHFNALARAFPHVKAAAINAMTHSAFNTQFGIGGVPTVMLFHNGRPAAKFNDSEYTLEMFARFITKYTGLEPVKMMFVASADFGGPVPSVLVRETDFWLGAAWAVVLAALGFLISRSRRWRALVDVIQSAWRDTNPHQHND